MKNSKQLKYWLFAAVLLMSIGSGLANTLSLEQISVKKLMQKMHSYKVENFEFAEFDGNHDKAKQCKLMEAFFVSSLLTPKNSKRLCNSFERYPSADSILLGEQSGLVLPVQIGTPTVDGDTAAVEVISDLRKIDPVGGVGRVVYFLHKTGEVWRIENAVYFDHWPFKPDDICKSEFIVPPTPEQKKYEVTNCRP